MDSAAKEAEAARAAAERDAVAAMKKSQTTTVVIAAVGGVVVILVIIAVVWYCKGKSGGTAGESENARVVANSLYAGPEAPAMYLPAQ